MDCFASLAMTFVPAFAATTPGRPRAMPSLSHPPVVNPVLPRQHLLCADRLDREVARQRHRPREVIDAPVPPRGVLNTAHPRAAQPPVAFQRGWDACCVVRGFAEAIGEHRGI